MNLYIMRHGETDWNRQGRLQGSEDIPLNEYGVALAQKTREGLEKEQIDMLKKDVMEKYNCSSKTFEDAPEENKEFLKLFSFICLLSFDVYMKKMLIEKLIDEMKDTKDKKEK